MQEFKIFKYLKKEEKKILNLIFLFSILRHLALNKKWYYGFFFLSSKITPH